MEFKTRKIAKGQYIVNVWNDDFAIEDRIYRFKGQWFTDRNYVGFNYKSEIIDYVKGLFFQDYKQYRERG